MCTIKQVEKETPETNINRFILSCFTTHSFCLSGDIAISEFDGKVAFEPEILGPSAPRGTPAGKPLRPLRHALPNNKL